MHGLFFCCYSKYGSPNPQTKAAEPMARVETPETEHDPETRATKKMPTKGEVFPRSKTKLPCVSKGHVHSQQKRCMGGIYPCQAVGRPAESVHSTGTPDPSSLCLQARSQQGPTYHSLKEAPSIPKVRLLHLLASSSRRTEAACPSLGGA